MLLFVGFFTLLHSQYLPHRRVDAIIVVSFVTDGPSDVVFVLFAGFTVVRDVIVVGVTCVLASLLG